MTSAKDTKNKPELFYDSGCLLCKKWVQVISKKTEGKLNLSPLNEEAEQLKYHSKDKVFVDHSAVEELIKDFPELANDLWLLPDKLKKPAAMAAYKWSAWLRKLLFQKKKCRSCD